MFFVSHVLFYIFHLGKQAASCSRYTHYYFRKPEILSNLGSDNSPSLFFGAYRLISLLNSPGSATTVLRYVFYPYYNTMAFLSLRLIAPYVHCLIFV